jgi:hypothetical protein
MDTTVAQVAILDGLSNKLQLTQEEINLFIKESFSLVQQLQIGNPRNITKNFLNKIKIKMDDVCRDEKYKDRCNAFYSAMQNNLHLTGGKKRRRTKKRQSLRKKRSGRRYKSFRR